MSLKWRVMITKINKKQANLYLKNHPFIDGNAKINNDGSITMTINLGPEKEHDMSKMDLILKKLENIEEDIKTIKSLPTIKKELKEIQK